MGAQISEEFVQGAARQDPNPAVVLESTVIAQGLPWPQNLQTALSLERVPDEGAVPLIIAILDGQVRIGLSEAELDRLARSAATAMPQGSAAEGHGNVPHTIRQGKPTRFPIVVAQKRSAGTTVSATLWLARRSGLKHCVMATGGLGGVHRGASNEL